MLAYIDLFQVSPLLNRYAADEILYQCEFNTILQSGDIDSVSRALDLYIDSKDRSLYKGCDISVIQFNNEGGKLLHKLKNLPYPIIRITSITTADQLRFVVNNMDRIRVEIYDPYAAISGIETHPNYCSISFESIWNYIINDKNTNLSLVMLEYDNRDCYQYLLDEELLQWFIDNDLHCLEHPHQPTTVDAFDILANAGYDFNIATELDIAYLEGCEDDFEEGSLLLLKLLQWRSSQGDKYILEYNPDEWSPETVLFINKHQ